MGNGNDRKSVTVSYASLGALGAILGIVITVWQVGGKIATKTDIESIRATVTEQDRRVRDLERQWDRFFGAQQKPSELETPTLETAPLLKIGLPGERPIRRIVVPSEFIRLYRLTPTEGGSYIVLGEDGRPYSIDDVLAVLVQAHTRIVTAREKTKNY